MKQTQNSLEGSERGEAKPLPRELPEHSAEMALWAAALQLMLEDGLKHWQNKGTPQLRLEREQAFDDLCECREMTRYLCSFLDLNPVWVSEQFILKCLNMA